MKRFTLLAILSVVLVCGICAQNAAQNITFNGYWEAPNGWIMLIKERIHVFVNPDGSYTGGTGGFSANTRQFTLQQTGADIIYTFTFNYTVIDKNSIQVTPVGYDDEWAKGVWKKRANIPGTKLKHQIIGYWEGKEGDKTRVLYFAGDDIVPPLDISYFSEEYAGQTIEQYGWAYTFDRNNNLVDISPILFSNRDNIFYGFDYGPFPIRFDKADLLVGQSISWGDMPNTETRFVRK
jgi:hypothetical protein